MTELLVSTSKDGQAAFSSRARAVARKLGVSYVPRSRVPSRHPALRYVVGGDGEHLVFPDERRLAAHPGMWVQKMRAGPRHPLIRAVRPLPTPTRVFDATAGLGQDSLHMAAFGMRVVAVERQPILACLLGGSLRGAGTKPWAEAACRVRVVHADAEEALRHCRTASLDVVFFDPMFGEPRNAAPDYDLFRRLAYPGRLTDAALIEGMRVAAQRVVVKVSANTAPNLKDRSPFNRRVASRAFDYWIVERTLVQPEWESPKVRCRGDPSTSVSEG